MANLNFLWPAIDDIEDAKKAAHMGAAAAFVVALITSVVTVLALRGIKLFAGVDASTFIDAGLFLFIGLFIYRFSRIAALAGVLLYIGEQIVTMKTTGYHFSIMPIILTCQFIAGVRGTFEYHHMKKFEDQEVKTQAAPPQIFPQVAQEAPKKKPVVLWMSVFILAAAAAGGGYYFWQQKQGSSPQRIVLPPDQTAPVIPSAGVSAPQEPAAPVPVSTSGESTFRMKDGKKITGRIITEDDVYYTVETAGGKQEIVIKEDIAQG